MHSSQSEGYTEQDVADRSPLCTPEPSDENHLSSELSARDRIAQDTLLDEHEAIQDGESKSVGKPKCVDTQSRIIWEQVIPIIGLHLLIPLAFLPYVFSWWGLLAIPALNYIFGSLGISAGYHRMLTHQGFKCPKWFERTLTTLGVCSLQDSPARWVLVHRVHHQHSDHQEDPHTPMVNGLWAHVGWLFIENRALTSADVYDRYVRDILKDPYYMWLQRNMNWLWVYVGHAIAFYGLGFLIGWTWTGTAAGGVQLGTQWFLFGAVYRTLWTWHTTWAINSATHMWGYQNYETRENSRNSWIFGILGYGEGWHNNHHADPRSASLGHRWWEIDMTFWWLVAFEKIGLVTELVRPNQNALERRTIK
jgi:stearoyl-CoA desaturase (delta-9 desaturase)